MKRYQALIFSVGLFFTSIIPTFAHFELGTYEGQDPLGNKCSITFNKVEFVGAKKHPVNERVQIQYLGSYDGQETGAALELRHRLVVDYLGKKYALEKSYLSGEANLDGAKVHSFLLEMVHTESKDGPDNFHAGILDLQTGKSAFAQCSDLNFIKE